MVRLLHIPAHSVRSNNHVKRFRSWGSSSSPKFNLYDLEIVCLGTTGTAKALDKDRVIKSYHPNEEEVAQVEQNIYKRLGAHPRHTKLP